MIDVSIQINPIEDLVKLSSLDKQLTFATATALTGTVQEAQEEVIKSIESTFITRNNWYLPSNRYGIHIKTAGKEDLVAELFTAADWLGLHEKGGVKRPKGRFLAIPTRNARSSQREIIKAGQRPKGLRGDRDFVIKTARGKFVLFQRKGQGRTSEMVAMYVLVPLARIKKQSTILEPTEKIVSKRFGDIYFSELAKAIETAK